MAAELTTEVSTQQTLTLTSPENRTLQQLLKMCQKLLFHTTLVLGKSVHIHSKLHSHMTELVNNMTEPNALWSSHEGNGVNYVCSNLAHKA